MENNNSHLNYLSNYANSNILDITYDECDKRTETTKSILHSHEVVFRETLPGKQRSTRDSCT